MKNISKSILFTALLAVLATLTGCGPDSYRSINGAVWNTTFHVTYNSGRNLDDSIRSVMRRVELSLSPFNDSSLISAVNRGEDVKADSLLRKVLECSRQVSRLSGGMYDPTLSPLINLWGFGYRNSDSIPDESMIAEALLSVGIDGCDITADGTVIKKSPLTEFNFSSITKGLACDEIGGMLARNGCTDYMVEIGGEIALSGRNSKGKPWRIGIEAPREGIAPGSVEAVSVINLTDCGVATSGNYRNYRKDDSGKSFGHTISAVTGRPVDTSTLSATVVAPSCMLADALATAVMAVDTVAVAQMADALPDVWIMLVTATPSGEYHISEFGTRSIFE
ncbi:MAG: FAD:protein FMN transferase [Muribaculaceae bacterium]|nr:FAD:protein FMN transferase [Muribaculaceae bacterium]